MLDKELKNIDKTALAGTIQSKLEKERTPSIRLCDHDCVNCICCIYDELSKVFVEIMIEKVARVWCKNE